MRKIWENYITELYDRPNRPEIVEIELEEKVDTDEKGPYILQSEVEKVTKKMRNKKAAGDDDYVPGDVLKLLGEGGLKIMKKLISTIYETGEWAKNITMLFVINSVQLVQRMPYQGSFGRIWRLQNRRANHSHCEICR